LGARLADRRRAEGKEKWWFRVPEGSNRAGTMRIKFSGTRQHFKKGEVWTAGSGAKQRKEKEGVSEKKGLGVEATHKVEKNRRIIGKVRREFQSFWVLPLA